MTTLREDINIQHDDGISVYLDDASITHSDRKEFVENEKYEHKVSSQTPEVALFEDVIMKSSFIKTFDMLIPEIDVFPGAKVLEMGACHGWASVMIKSRYPEAYTVASDLVSEMVKHSNAWEQLLNVNIDEKWSFNCRDIPFADHTFDRIFTFASFHHFGADGDYQPVLQEMIRILKPGGKICLLYEPSSPKYLYPFAYDRVNSKRKRGMAEDIDEDVLVVSQLAANVKPLNCVLEAKLCNLHLYRDSFLAGIYYYVLSKLGPLQNLFVGCVNIVISKSMAQ